MFWRWSVRDLFVSLLLGWIPFHSAAMSLKVSGAGVRVLNGFYQSRPSTLVPEGFAATCARMRWNAGDMWNQLAVPQAPWYEHDNGSYMYLHQDGRWWMDDPSGAGIYVCPAIDGSVTVPSGGWQPLSGGVDPMPTVHLEADNGDEL